MVFIQILVGEGCNFIVRASVSWYLQNSFMFMLENCRSFRTNALEREHVHHIETCFKISLLCLSAP